MGGLGSALSWVPVRNPPWANLKKQRHPKYQPLFENFWMSTEERKRSLDFKAEIHLEAYVWIHYMRKVRRGGPLPKRL